MPARDIPGLNLRAYWALGEAGWKTGMDENIWRLSFMVQARVSGVVEELPVDPENGDRYILVDSGSAFNNHMAIWDVDIWAYIEPEHGFIIFNNENGHLLRYNSTINQWVELISPEAIKELYEANDDTNAFTNAEKNKLADIENDATADMSAAEIKAAYESNLNTNAFTDAEKAKLSGLSSSRFLGVYPTLSGLQAAHPAPPAGSFAYVDSGPTTDIMSYIWDANSVKYVPQASGNTQETPESIKEKYELNDDTNAFTDAEKSKLDLIEDGATGDLSGSEIKVLYEAEPDTNAFTDAEKSKLNGIEAGATADQTASEIKTAYESNANTNAFTDAEQTKLAGIEDGATGDLSAGEVKTLYESNTNTNAFTDAEKAKLAGLESSLFVGTYTSVLALETAHPSAAIGAYAYVDAGVGQDVSLYIWDNDDTAWVQSISGVASETPSSVKSKYESNPDTNAFTDTEKSKLAGIEDGATADMSAAEIKSAYENNSNTNAFTDAEKSKLAGVEAGATADMTGAELVAALDSQLGGSGWQGGGISDAASDGKYYVRRNGAWEELPKAMTINTRTANYVLAIADINAYVRMNLAGVNTLTVPENSSVAFPIGTIIHLRQTGAGQTTVVAAGVVVINTSETLKLRKQGSSAALIKVATNEWDLTGDLELA